MIGSVEVGIVNSDSSLIELKECVYEANMRLYRSGLVPLTFGNVSERITFEGGFLVGIKPSGVSYERLRVEDISVVTQEGNALPGALRPSSDTPTHLVVYQEFPHWHGVAHTHSVFATSWAQAGVSIPLLGTTHADYAPFAVPCAPPMDDRMISLEYERNTGIHLVDHLKSCNATESPMALVHAHGPFAFGKSGNDAVDSAIALENIAEMAYYSLAINPQAGQISRVLINRHYSRKHGSGKYYGQE